MSTVTFGKVCRAHMKCQVIIKMNKFNMFITAVCVLLLIKLRWPKNKSIHDTVFLASCKLKLSLFLEGYHNAGPGGTSQFNTV